MKTKPLVNLVLLLILFLTPTLKAQNNTFKVVIDAGHGGHDPGATYYGFKEKEIALNITLLAGGLLEKNKDIKVIYTRKKDVFLGLRERADIANKASADLFVSIHANAAANTSAYGTETFVLGLHKSQANFEVVKKENQVIYLEDNYEEKYGDFDPSSPESLIGLTLMQEEYLDQSIELASYIQNNFTKRLKRRDRSVKQAGFWVLHNTFMPSVLVETGFISNRKEGNYLNSKKGQQEMATSIAQAITEYYNSVKTSYNGSNTNVSESVASSDAVPIVDIYEDILFKVQIAASSKKLDTKPNNFKGLSMISRAEIEGLYKYYYGNTSDYALIKALQVEARKKGYSSAFIVAYKNGKQVKLADIIN